MEPASGLVAPSPTTDSTNETKRIAEFVAENIRSSGAKGVIVGLSGGVDSAVAGALCIKSLGKEKVFALLMPSKNTPSSDLDDARELVRSWGVRSAEVGIDKVVSGLVGIAGIDGSRVAKANLQARVRMTILYYFANTLRYLVCGTGDRSEIEMGYYTKWGDGGVDFLRIAHLYKTQVRKLGAHLGIPSRIVEKPASPQLWPGHKATDELPLEYEKLDLVLYYLFDRKTGAGEAASGAGVSRRLVSKVLRMHRKTEHKRIMPPSLL
jgi:NAD+ synthase